MIKPGKQSFLVLTQDPGVTGPSGGRVFATVYVPAERYALGLIGYRVKAVDFDAEAGVLYKAHAYQADAEGRLEDIFAARLPPPGSKLRKKAEDQLLANPAFHRQNVYALVMRTLARFEYALGRGLHRGFDGHQLHVTPHAFVDANASYSREDRALIFGYFRADQEPATSNAEVTSKICHVTRNDRYLLTSCQSQTRRQRRLSLHCRHRAELSPE
jgi:hypothetical protein